MRSDLEATRLRRRRQVCALYAAAIRDDYFADVLCLLHITKRVDDFRGIESPVRQGMQELLPEQVQQLGEQALREVGALRHQLIGVNAEVAQVVAERAQAHARIFVEVALAELQEAAEGFEYAQIAVDSLTGEGIQNHVDALSLRQLENLVGKVETARIENMLNAEQTQEIVLLIGARRGIDFGAAPLRHLDCGNADAAG